MGTAASTFVNPANLDSLGAELTPESRARRAKQRRQILAMFAISVLIDTGVLLLYALAGTIPVTTSLAYAVCGLPLLALNFVLSQLGFNDRFKDHYMVVPQSLVCVIFVLVFTYIAPAVGVLFLCTLFILFSFSSLRSTPAQTTVIWTVTTIGLASLFLLTNKPISIPHGNHLERVATLLVLVLAIGRCMFLGIFSSSLKQSLYQSKQKLREAYKRIEELAELDELTGSYNRRCIMRMLDEEIVRTGRTGAPCSIALIDLDWFKRINDAFGHPTGDEVLRTFAITMFANIRGIDRFGRYGGEEFLLVLPDMSTDNAARTLERLRAIIAELDWSAFSPDMSVTISAGVATLQPEESPDTFLARADRALYAAKARGRNRIAHA